MTMPGFNNELKGLASEARGLCVRNNCLVLRVYLWFFEYVDGIHVVLHGVDDD